MKEKKNLINKLKDMSDKILHPYDEILIDLYAEEIVTKKGRYSNIELDNLYFDYYENSFLSK